ncbi:BTAD domain-containing putative transcriptional regulator, partial [Mesorhizobium japonicum]|uniref:AfsR/SARP family transcriptional regulator n=1 Tax=Mesorhizobium japonicum TaxID=2066070 RepID=UPI003B5A5B51
GAEAALALGRTASAAAAARELVERNPLDERAHRILIRSLAVAGDRAGAIRAFEDCRSVLAEQLGMDPAPETAAVYLEVLRSGAAAGGTLPAPPRNGFFGRQEELARIVTGLAEPGIVAVLGRGGIGKSRMALHAAHALASVVPGGRYWVPLGDLRSPDLVAVSVARAVGAEEGPDPIAAATAVLAPAGAVLLVLDGVEDVVDG